jgi:DNA polymerase
MNILWGDLETYSETPIKNGTYAYAADSEIMLFTWAIDDGPAACWDLTAGEPMPDALIEALIDDDVVINFQNSMFDRSVFQRAKNSTPLLREVGAQITRWRDTMVKALAHSLPGGLDKTCAILKIDAKDSKMAEGKNLIQLFCKPRPKNAKLERATRHTHPVDWDRFKQYAINDISAMRAVDKKLPVWNYKDSELDLWHLDQKINDRGVLIDVEFAAAAIEAAEKAKKDLARRTVEITNGEVASATKRDQMLLHILMEYGVDLPDMQASTLERRINDPDIPWALRELLDIRLQASMGSTSKYKAMLKAVNDDGRVRGLLQFDGANRTRRWAGRTVQPQNMYRPPKYIKKQWEFAIEAIRTGCADLFFDNVMEVTAATARGAIIAPKGKKLVVADLSNIEGRDQAWLAGESWKLRAFRDYDDGTGHDLYKLAYAKSFRMDAADVDDEQRQVGKVQELALGYEGGVGAFLTFSLAYNIDLEAMAEEAYSYIPRDVLDDAKGFHDWTIKKKRSTFGLSERAFITCDSFKRLWRAAHPEVSSLWGELKAAASDAINSPGNTITCRMFKIRRDGAWLRIGLPSGQPLCYPAPQVDDKGQISYMGVNQYTRKWTRVKTYGGKLFENACQSLARDVMAANMAAIEAAGYEIILTVHDEVICEAPDSDEFNAQRLSALLSTNPRWAEDMPLAAAGYEAYRYRKD